MAMTREEVLAEMESSFAEMTEEERTNVLFADDSGAEWSPALLIAEVRGDTDIGKKYVQSWSDQRDGDLLLQQLLGDLLAGGGKDLMTCGDPDCTNCKGEVRPFDVKPGMFGDDPDPDPNVH
jgi:hypothetical protein